MINDYSEEVAVYNASVASHINSVQAAVFKSRIECEGSRAQAMRQNRELLEGVRTSIDAWHAEEALSLCQEELW